MDDLPELPEQAPRGAQTSHQKRKFNDALKLGNAARRVSNQYESLTAGCLAGMCEPECLLNVSAILKRRQLTQVAKRRVRLCCPKHSLAQAVCSSCQWTARTTSANQL